MSGIFHDPSPARCARVSNRYRLGYFQVKRGKELGAYELVECAKRERRIPPSLRDYIAVEAMVAYLSMAADPTEVAKKCYSFADEMLAIRTCCPCELERP